MDGSRLPLPLELTQPVLLAGDLNTELRNAYGSRAHLCSSTCSSVHCKSVDRSGVQIDVNIDVQIDDVIA